MATDKHGSTLILEMSYRCSSAFICGQLNEMQSRVRQIHPEASDREIFLRVTAHQLNRQTMLRVYGWHADSSD
jgi:hypothetical protein